MIKELIDQQMMDLSLNARTKEGAFNELAHLLIRQDVIEDYHYFLEDILERESLGSTGFGFGIAIPHAKSRYVKKPAIVFGRSEHGILYDSIDGKPVYLIFMIAMPDTNSKQHLMALAWLSRHLMHADFRESLLNARSTDEILRILHKAEEDAS